MHRRKISVKSKVNYDYLVYLLLAGLNLSLNLYHTSFKEFGFSYYSANALAVKNGGWLNLLTGAMDEYGFQAVDKPLLSYFSQSLLAKIFGVNSITLTLPSMIFVWLSAIIIYRIILKLLVEINTYKSDNNNKFYALIGAMIFSLSPAAVIHNRDNLVDPLVTLLLLLILNQTIKTYQSPKVSNFIYLGLWLGLSYLVKVGMLIPSFLTVAILLILANPTKKGIIITRVTTTGIISVIPISLYIFWYDYLLASPPRLTSGKSQLDLLINFNSFSRLPWSTPKATWFGFSKYREIGFERLFSANYIDLWYWLLPLAIIGISWVLVLVFKKDISDQGKFIVKILLSTLSINFMLLSFTGSKVCCTHPYYSIILIPAVAIFATLGLLTLNDLFKKWQGRFLASSLIIGIFLFYQKAIDQSLKEALSQLLSPFVSLRYILSTLLVILVIIFLTSRFKPKVVLFLILSIILTLPNTLITVASINNPAIQQIGADQRAGRNTYFGQNMDNYKIVANKGIVINQLYPNGKYIENMTFTLATPSQISDQLNLVVNSLPKKQLWKIATLDSFNASLLYLKTKAPVLAVGGGSGTESIVSFEEFLNLVIKDEIGYFALDPHAICMVNPNLGYSVRNGSNSALILDWVTMNGIRAIVPGEFDYSLPTLFKLPSERARESLSAYRSKGYKVAEGNFNSGIKHCELP